VSVVTKTGDKGQTSVYDAKSGKTLRVAKDSAQIEAIGTIDELNSYIGVITSEVSNTDVDKKLRNIQKELFTIGSILAGSELAFAGSRAKRLETQIEKMEHLLPTLANFILPGGEPLAAKCMYARALARRAERSVIAYGNFAYVKKPIRTYLNRLSDYLFVMSRMINSDAGDVEQLWIGRRR